MDRGYELSKKKIRNHVSVVHSSIETFSKNELGDYTSAIIDVPDYFLWLKQRFSGANFDFATYRRLINRALNKAHETNIDNGLVLLLQSRIKAAGRKRWGFQHVLLEIFVSPSTFDEMSLEVYDDVGADRYFLKAFQFMAHLGAINSTYLKLPGNDPTFHALEMQRRVLLSLPECCTITFATAAADCVRTKQPALYSNAIAKQLANGDVEKEHLFTLPPEIAADFYSKVMCAKPGQAICVGLMPFYDPRDLESPYSYQYSYCFPLNGLVHLFCFPWKNDLTDFTFDQKMLLQPMPTCEKVQLLEE